MAWAINDSYPYQDTLGDLIPIFSEPYPIGFFQQNDSINDGYPYVMTNKSLIKVLKEPLPTGFFTISEGEYPKFAGLNLLDTGAFCRASNLEKIVIPESVKYIGETAFRYTKIKEVTISKDCTYYPTSFPEGCKIKNY